MRFALDANEYIFALGLFRKESSEAILKAIVDSFPRHNLCTCRTIVEEVRANLTPQEFREFIRIINTLLTIDDDLFIPFHLGAKYETEGLKPADALIAAYTEWAGADALVTENRHFLSRRAGLPFKVLKAEDCLKVLGK